jgi:predicted kinase
MTFTIPELSLVVLIGPSGCGKSTFARKHFKPTEVMSSDAFRALVSDDENDQSSTDDAFAALHFVAARRLARAKLTVVDATNVQPEARKPLVALAREYHVLPVAIVLDLPERVCHDRNRSRPDRDFGPHVIRNQKSQLHRSLRGLGREGFRHVHVLKSQEEVDAAVIERQPLWNNRKQDNGPFDIIGDVHGCTVSAPSVWTRRVRIVREYARLEGVHVPVAMRSTADVLIVGASSFDMTYEYAEINGRMVAPH